eukprot:tig00020693_g13022.t1
MVITIVGLDLAALPARLPPRLEAELAASRWLPDASPLAPRQGRPGPGHDDDEAHRWRLMLVESLRNWAFAE